MAAKIESYRDLIVWQQAMDLAVSIYETTRAWPKDERYGLTAQVRRAATSVPANIAEGYGRESRASYQQFLRIAGISQRVGDQSADRAARRNHLPSGNRTIDEPKRERGNALAAPRPQIVP
ncbi:hypothetical protein MesoLj131c_61170 [Mesorhizobium sp. 131-3-5]|nr:hypothetical protein MesoLj131b_60730 [Mesorhizobium sp. 131-2-5]BCH11859.1 hypothetical protein MesoLj131c_61170 [Mesorhizobium sp. 131-3-5]